MRNGLFGLALAGVVTLQPAHAMSAGDAAEQLLELVSAGVQMEQYRHSGSTSDLQVCGDLMRSNQTKARDLRSQISDISNVDTNLIMGAALVERCVSCLPNATAACGEVEDLLDELEE